MRPQRGAWGTSIRVLILTGVTAGSLFAASAAAAEDTPEATPAAYTAPPPGSFTTPAHAWADPTHPAPNGDLVFAPVEFHFLLGTRWVAHGTAPLMVTGGVTHCQIAKPGFGASLSCAATGTPRPGETTMSVGIRSEGGDDFSWTVPLTVCPLTGCSDLFSVTAGGSVAVCPGAELASAGRFSYDFNVPWNASAVVFGPLPAAAGGEWEIKTENPTDGASFWIDGRLENPGSYPVSFTVTDEFGGDHDATATVRVREPTDPACAMLASTGVNPAPATVWMLALLLSGGGALAAARRRTSTRQ